VSVYGSTGNGGDIALGPAVASGLSGAATVGYATTFKGVFSSAGACEDDKDKDKNEENKKKPCIKK
jgi:hypothetical protein